MTSAAFSTFSQILLVLGAALMVFKLYRARLHRQYPIFFSFLIFRAVVWSWLLSISDTSSALYFYSWICTEPISLAFYILVVAELYRLVLDKYRGLYTIGRWAMYASVVVSAFISVLSLLPKLKPSLPQRSRIMGYLVMTERGVDTALALFIFLILLFLSRYPVRLNRNTRVHAVVYAVFFLSSTVALLLRTLLGMRVAASVNTALIIFSACSVLAWLVFLTPAGEKIQDKQSRMEPEQEKRLLGQLDVLNATLLRVSRQQMR